MTKITIKTHGDALDYLGLHILTYAEEGFSPLGIHGRKLARLIHQGVPEGLAGVA